MERRVWATLLLCLAPGLTGCVAARVHPVRKILRAPVVQSTSLSQLVSEMQGRADAIQTATMTVEITAATGGGATGEVKTFPSFSGYIFLRKPAELRVLLLVPVLRSKAMDMVSDGKTFTLYIPPRNKAVTGTNEVAAPSKNGLENLRPAVFLDSLLVQGPGPDKIVTRTLDTRIIEPTDKAQALIEQPDYDLEILGRPRRDSDVQTIETERVVHIGRDNLLPYRQDVYDATGQIVTRANYSNYQRFGAIEFPAKIVIERPLDAYTLTLSITKATFNEKLEDDQFELKIPDTVPVQQIK